MKVNLDRPFYPPLLAAFPVVSVFSANVSLVPLSSLPRPLIISMLGASLIWLFSSLILRKVERGAAVTAVFMLFFFGYSRFMALSPAMPKPMGWLWTGLLIVFVALAAWKLTAHRILNVLSSLLLVFALLQVGIGYAKVLTVQANSDVQSMAGKTASVKPDIFYIILDGYGRSDALKRALNFDNSKFVDGLKQRGFFVANQSHANYCQTELSLASSLNMNLIQTQLPTISKSEIQRGTLDKLIENNAVKKYLKNIGYQFVAITSGFPAFDFGEADVSQISYTSMTLLESVLIDQTPIDMNQALAGSMYHNRRGLILNGFSSLKGLKDRGTYPRFVFAHILAPHPPFVFTANGAELDHKGPYGYWDGSDYFEYKIEPDYRTGYTGQAEFIGNQVLDTIDVLTGTSGLKPIIIIQGDHGSKLRLDQNSLAKTDLKECFPNLCAVFGPKEVTGAFYDSITPVNIFRTVFNAQFDDKLPQQPDKSWYSTFGHPYDFTEVTDRAKLNH